MLFSNIIYIHAYVDFYYKYEILSNWKYQSCYIVGVGAMDIVNAGQ
jgi:hypothetical protein